MRFITKHGFSLVRIFQYKAGQSIHVRICKPEKTHILACLAQYSFPDRNLCMLKAISFILINEESKEVNLSQTLLFLSPLPEPTSLLKYIFTIRKVSNLVYLFRSPSLTEFVLYSGADLGLLQHPRWSAL